MRNKEYELEEISIWTFMAGITLTGTGYTTDGL